jgi:transposase InsO family protein
MSWKACTVMSERRELVSLYQSGGVTIAELSRRFGVSRKTAHKWKDRHSQEGDAGLSDRSRRPQSSPDKTPESVEKQIVELRRAHPAWGSRKLRVVLSGRGVKDLPSASTITTILHRHGMISEEASRQREPWQRFEKASPNELWQMDFKGHFAMSNGERCHPLTVLDDHSRYCVVLQACANEQGTTVKSGLITAFRKYGMPWKMLMDNGPPWGFEVGNPWTALTVWLLRLGVQVCHGRPYHPQTQGKEERFHRTLKEELLRWHEFADLGVCDARFRQWREVYNHERPHQALNFAVPASRYQASSRSYPETLPALEYPEGDEVRKVHDGWISLHGRDWRIGRGFNGELVVVRPRREDGEQEVWYAGQCVGMLCERDEEARAMERRTRTGEGGKLAPVAALPTPTFHPPQCT